MPPTADGKATVATVVATEPLRPPPAVPFPAALTVSRQASAQALVAYRGTSHPSSPTQT